MGPMVILVIVVTAVVTAALGAAWAQMLEYRRRAAAMEVIKAAIVAGREPPREVLNELTGSGAGQGSQWSVVVAFTALSVGFWIAWWRTQNQEVATAFLVVAATMTVTAAGCALLALTSSRGAAHPEDGR